MDKIRMKTLGTGALTLLGWFWGTMGTTLTAQETTLVLFDFSKPFDVSAVGRQDAKVGFIFVEDKQRDAAAIEQLSRLPDKDVADIALVNFAGDGRQEVVEHVELFVIDEQLVGEVGYRQFAVCRVLQDRPHRPETFARIGSHGRVRAGQRAEWLAVAFDRQGCAVRGGHRAFAIGHTQRQLGTRQLGHRVQGFVQRPAPEAVLQ